MKLQNNDFVLVRVSETISSVLTDSQDLELACVNAPVVADLFEFVMREASCCLFLTIIKLMVLQLSTLPTSDT